MAHSGPKEKTVTIMSSATPIAPGEGLIVWLNGAFGVGKTTTARELVRCLPGARIFDPEVVGRMLRTVIAEPIEDFQDWPAWRTIVAETVLAVRAHDRSTVIAPMTVLRRDYAAEIFSLLAGRGAQVRHVVLHADTAELTRRINADWREIAARGWRKRHLPAYQDALGWLREQADIVDTTGLAATAVAQRVADLVSAALPAAR
jgi:hypothetical protein